ncbi:unnamed protein product [Caenorhabditis auriculariae]|uniref:Uncharacterized protein n=1 Tax=Caenorhabditis auriculariae TaxID=2777116 RepID=A0A8S1H6T9_9PELO|nr:unnamed protein product [Caenorhabditis auriculariae]
MKSADVQAFIWPESWQRWRGPRLRRRGGHRQILSGKFLQLWKVCAFGPKAKHTKKKPYVNVGASDGVGDGKKPHFYGGASENVALQKNHMKMAELQTMSESKENQM